MKEIYKCTDNYTIVALHSGVFQVSLFIFLPQGRTDSWNILITHRYDGEINHNQLLLIIGVSHRINYVYDKYGLMINHSEYSFL